MPSQQHLQRHIDYTEPNLNTAVVLNASRIYASAPQIFSDNVQHDSQILLLISPSGIAMPRRAYVLPMLLSFLNVAPVIR